MPPPRRLALLCALCALRSGRVAALHALVTGASGYLGTELVHVLVEQGHTVTAGVRALPAAAHLPLGDGGETTTAMECRSRAVVLDMMDDDAWSAATEGCDVVFHVASVFKRCEDMEREMVAPNIAGALAAVRACAARPSVRRLVLTSSMAAVRGPGQRPARGAASFSAARDWNDVSARDGPGMAPYQFSKAESERAARDLAAELGVEMVALCPSMMFGPPRNAAARAAARAAFSVAEVRAWARGERLVQSRLVADVRDVAAAHVAAATAPLPADDGGGGARRFIVSSEARVPAARVAAALRALRGNAAIASDDEFDGGAVPIGAREVETGEAEVVLGVRCRPPLETIVDMAEALLQEDEQTTIAASSP